MDATAHLGYLSVPVLALVACVHMPRMAAEARTSPTREASTVLIESTCSTARSGSGVIISRRHVLTAAHIVSCATLPMVHATYTNESGEHRLRMVVTDEDWGTGIARLEIASAETFRLDIKPPIVRSPYPGNHVCANLANNPERGDKPLVACGTVALTGTVVKQMSTHAADDGAPVYGERGALVGIVVNRGESNRWPYTWIASIDGGRWLDGITAESPPPDVIAATR